LVAEGCVFDLVEVAGVAVVFCHPGKPSGVRMYLYPR
jgi:hypothetical protein